MSEHSESVHLWRATAAATREIALRSRIIGRIVATNERWTCFVPFEDDELEMMASAASGIALYWSYFDNDGLRLVFFEGDVRLGEIGFEWGRVLSAGAPTEPRLSDRLERTGIVENFGSLRQMAARVAANQQTPRAFRDRAAEALGLAAYEWLSPRYCRDTPLEHVKAQFPAAEDVEDVEDDPVLST